MLPDAQGMIEICFRYGSDFYQVTFRASLMNLDNLNKAFKCWQKNSEGFHPLHYAVQSLSEKNLRTLLKQAIGEAEIIHRYVEVNVDHYEKPKREFLRSLIVNKKMKGGNNYLHFLIELLNEPNYSEISEMIKLLLVHGCHPNTFNEEEKTPFNCLLIKLQKLKVNNSLCSYFKKHFALNLSSHRCKVRTEKIDNREESNRPKDIIYVNELLSEWNEINFVRDFDEYKNNALQSLTSLEFMSQLGQLLEESIIRNFSNAAAVILSSSVDVNAVPNVSKYSKAPAFLACNFGHHEVLKVLLKSDRLKFKLGKLNILHEIVCATSIQKDDRNKCFNLIISDDRCDLNIINNKDDNEHAPLYYACVSKMNGIAKELLKRGAFIGHEDVIENMNKEVLSDFLDDCINCSRDFDHEETEVQIDFSFLQPSTHDSNKLESDSLRQIASKDMLKELIMHPVIYTFVSLKWKKIDFFIYLNLLIYFVFMLCFGTFIIFFFSSECSECLRDDDCSQEKLCLKNICEDRCTVNCGFGARCEKENETLLCNCNFGFERDPDGKCFPIPYYQGSSFNFTM